MASTILKALVGPTLGGLALILMGCQPTGTPTIAPSPTQSPFELLIPPMETFSAVFGEPFDIEELTSLLTPVEGPGGPVLAGPAYLSRLVGAAEQLLTAPSIFEDSFNNSRVRRILDETTRERFTQCGAALGLSAKFLLEAVTEPMIELRKARIAGAYLAHGLGYRCTIEVLIKIEKASER